MEERKLDEMLEALHQELETADSLDDHTQELLQNVLADIETLLEKTDQEHPPHSLAERLNEVAYRLDSSYHPLIAAIGQVVNALSNMGI